MFDHNQDKLHLKTTVVNNQQYYLFLIAIMLSKVRYYKLTDKEEMFECVCPVVKCSNMVAEKNLFIF